MRSFREFDSLLLDEAAKKKPEEWTPPLSGVLISKHLGKAHIRGIVSDEDYAKHVKDKEHFPVFRVNKVSPTLKKVRVGNTKGDHFVEYDLNKSGTVLARTVYKREQGLHPNVTWGIHSKWKLEDEKEKGKKK